MTPIHNVIMTIIMFFVVISPCRHPCIVLIIIIVRSKGAAVYNHFIHKSVPSFIIITGK